MTHAACYTLLINAYKAPPSTPTPTHPTHSLSVT